MFHYQWQTMDRWPNCDQLVRKNVKADGNCQFYCISEALAGTVDIDADGLRQVAAMQVSLLDDARWQMIRHSYILEVQTGMFSGGWNPFEVNSREDFANFILSPLETGNYRHFEGDQITLILLSEALGVNFIVVDTTKESALVINDTIGLKKFIMLFYFSEPNYKHYQLLGLVQQNHTIQVIQNDINKIPLIIREKLSSSKVKDKRLETKQVETKQVESKVETKQVETKQKPTEYEFKRKQELDVSRIEVDRPLVVNWNTIEHQNQICNNNSTEQIPRSEIIIQDVPQPRIERIVYSEPEKPTERLSKLIFAPKRKPLLNASVKKRDGWYEFLNDNI